MAALSIQDISPSGHTPAYTSVDSNDTILTGTGQRVFLHVKNNSGGTISVTITAHQSTAVVSGVGNLTISNRVVSVPGGEERMIGPFTEAFIGTDSNVNVGYSATASVIAAAFQLPAQY